MEIIKLHPKNIRFCPGCSNKLQLKKPATFTIDNVQLAEDTKVVTILKKNKKDNNTVSLF